jgi:protein arginine kinase activator
MGQCKHCGNESNYLFRSAITKEVTDVFLCESCFQQYYGGEPLGMIGDEVVVKEDKTALFDKSIAEKLIEIKCQKCNTSLAEIGKTLKLGCESCYATFSDLLATAESQIEKKNVKGKEEVKKTEEKPEAKKETYTGSVKEGKLKILEDRLKLAIKNESYEEAAELRDLINTIKDEEQ